jgi:hypothetical protein
MKRLIIGLVIIILAILLWVFVISTPPALTEGTGAYGIIEYGQGDCFPSGGVQWRNYSAFTGEVVFVKEQDLPKIAFTPTNSEARKQFIAASLKTMVTDGKYQAPLEPGQYYVVKANTDGREAYGSGAYSTGVLIPSSPPIRKDFKIFICTSL